MAMQPMNGTRVQVLLALGLLALFASSSPVGAQNPEPAKPEAQAQQQPVATSPVIRTESRVVLVDAVASSHAGRITQSGESCSNWTTDDGTVVGLTALPDGTSTLACSVARPLACCD